MENCKKYDLKIMGCSRQTEPFQDSICIECLKETKETPTPHPPTIYGSRCGSPEDKKAIIERLREKTGIEVGMSEQEALERFSALQEKIKTCGRCLPDFEYKEWCPFIFICKEIQAQEEVRENVTTIRRDDNRSRVDEDFRVEPQRLKLLTNRKRDALR